MEKKYKNTLPYYNLGKHVNNNCPSGTTLTNNSRERVRLQNVETVDLFDLCTVYCPTL
jgi:hypothetical protein